MFGNQPHTALLNHKIFVYLNENGRIMLRVSPKHGSCHKRQNESVFIGTIDSVSTVPSDVIQTGTEARNP